MRAKVIGVMTKSNIVSKNTAAGPCKGKLKNANPAGG